MSLPSQLKTKRSIRVPPTVLPGTQTGHAGGCINIGRRNYLESADLVTIYLRAQGWKGARSRLPGYQVAHQSGASLFRIIPGGSAFIPGRSGLIPVHSGLFRVHSGSFRIRSGSLFRSQAVELTLVDRLRSANFPDSALIFFGSTPEPRNGDPAGRSSPRRRNAARSRSIQIFKERYIREGSRTINRRAQSTSVFSLSAGKFIALNAASFLAVRNENTTSNLGVKRDRILAYFGTLRTLRFQFTAYS